MRIEEAAAALAAVGSAVAASAAAVSAKVNGDRNVVLKCYEVQPHTYGVCYDNYLWTHNSCL